MKIKSEKFQFMLERETLCEVDDWRFANRIGSRAEAIRQLIASGLEKEKAEAADTTSA